MICRPYLLALILLLISSLTGLSFGQIGWEWAFSEPSSLESSGQDVTVDSLDNIYVAGYFRGEAQFGDTALNAVADSDIFVAKYDSHGSLVWINQAGLTNYNYGTSIALDDSLNVYVAGNMMILKYNSMGKLLWQKYLPTDYHWEHKRRVLALSDERIIVASRKAIHAFSRGGELLMDKNLEVTSFSKFENGSFAAATSDQILVMDDEFSVQKTLSLPAGIENIWGLVLKGKEILLTGLYSGPMSIGDSTFSGSHNMIIARLDSTGQVIWANQAGGDSYDMGNSMLVNDRNQVFVAGTYRNVAVFDSLTLGRLGMFEEIFVAEYDFDNGSLVDLIHAGGDGDFDVAYSISALSGNQFIVTGSLKDFSQGVNFGDIVVTARNGNIDFFLAKVGQPEVKSRISGQVLVNGDPDYTWIKLFRIHEDTSAERTYYIPTGSDGIFNLDVYSKGTYLIQAHYYTPSYINTYYEEDFMWDQATRLYIDNDTIIDSVEINLIPLPELSGANTISGTVYDAEDQPKRFIDMILVSATDDPIAHIRTDTMGNYSFTTVPDGDYKIWVDTAGMIMAEFYEITVSSLKSTNEEYAGYDYYLRDGKIYTVELNTHSVLSSIESKLSLFPVPAIDVVYLSTPDGWKSDAFVMIFDMKGGVIKEYPQIVTSCLDVSDLNNGIYLVMLYSNHTWYHSKIIIQR